MRRFDAVVVGAGPGGLSAGAELSARGSCLVLDEGPEPRARRRDSPEDVLSGVGGAGLFSDGKHSFFPSASALWRLPDRAALAGAFEATAALLHRRGVDAGPLPEPEPEPDLGLSPDPDRARARARARAREVVEAWSEKRYPSLYVGFAERLAMIEELWAAAGERWHGASVTRVTREAGDLVVAVAGREPVRTGALVIATGRWSPRWIRPWLEPLGVAYAYRRVEIGVRIEARVDNELFARLPGVDGKLVLRDGLSEIRTFCTCRDGEVVLGRAHGIEAFSGRADGPRTGRSNVGLVVRRLDPAARVRLDGAPASFGLRAWRAEGARYVERWFGEAAGEITSAMERLVAWAPGPRGLDAGDVRVHAPCLEGVGDYPVDDGSLQLAPGVWIAGDACGRFRGIVAGMISGRYVARRISS